MTVDSGDATRGSEIYLKVEGLKTQFFTSRGIVKALDEIDLVIKKGEIYGLVGESGCGKSVTAQSIMYLVPDPPGRIVSGKIFIDRINILSGIDRLANIIVKSETNVKIKRNKRLIKRHNYIISGIRGSKVSMIFQEPALALNPVIRIGDQISESILLHLKVELVNAILRREMAERKDYQALVDRMSKIFEKEERTKEIRRWCESFSVPDAEELVQNIFSTYQDPDRVIDSIEFIVDERKSGVDIQRLARAREYYEFQQKEFVTALKLAEAESEKDPSAIDQARQEIREMKSQTNSLLSFRIIKRIIGRRVEAPLRDAANRRVIELLKLVNIPEPERVSYSYPHELSGGMQQRVMIAMALASNPRLLIADEPTTALDVTTQAQILDLIRNLNKTFGSSILFITHDLAVIAQMCSRVGVMYGGNIVEEADINTIFENSKHPYTIGLLRTLPSIDSKADKRARLDTITGTVPNLITPPTGCRFHPRCKFKMDICVQKKPDLIDLGGSHKVACFLYEEKGRSLQ